MKKMKLAFMVMITMLAVNTVIATDITYTNAAYFARMTDRGDISQLCYPTNSPDHVWSLSGILYHSGGGSTFISSAFRTLASNNISGNSVDSVIKSDAVAVAIHTDFLEKSIAQRYIVTCITNVPLNDVVYYHFQDGALLGADANDTVDRDAPTRVMYQTQSNMFLGTCLYKPDMQQSDRYQGGKWNIVKNSALTNFVDNTITQTSDSAVVVGFPVGTLNPGESFTALVRIGLGSNLTQMLEAAFPANFAPEISKFRFGVNFKKTDKDTMSFSADFDPTTVGLTKLDNYLASLYVGEYEVLNNVAGAVKSGKNGGKATYILGDNKALLKLNTKKSTAQMKVKVKKADLADSLGVINNGAPGQLDLPVRFWLSSTGFAGAESVSVPYKNKQDKNAKGKQPKDK